METAATQTAGPSAQPTPPVPLSVKKVTKPLMARHPSPVSTTAQYRWRRGPTRSCAAVECRVVLCLCRSLRRRRAAAVTLRTAARSGALEATRPLQRVVAHCLPPHAWNGTAWRIARGAVRPYAAHQSAAVSIRCRCTRRRHCYRHGMGTRQSLEQNWL